MRVQVPGIAECMRIWKRHRLGVAKGVRTCIGCGQKAGKPSLYRLTRSSASGELVLDAKGNGPGRGAYVCSMACFDEATRRRGFNRALRCKLDGDFGSARDALAELVGTRGSV